VNSVQLVGKLTRVPSVRFEGEHQTASFTLAVTESWGANRVLYVPCRAWGGKQAEACALLNAEDLVSIQGKLTWQKRPGKCGQEHSQIVVSVRECTVLEAAEAEVPA
jgi:single-stranded DNA-binding protein